MTVPLSDILRFLNAEDSSLGEVDRDINEVASIIAAKEGDLTFCWYVGARAMELVNRSSASAIICSELLQGLLAEDPRKTFVLVKNPRLAFLRVFRTFFPPGRPKGIHPSASIGSGCSLTDDVYIGANATIGNGVQIGGHSEIHPGVCIGDNVRIGRDVIIHAGAVIGGDGFGLERNDKGELEMFPHKGSVVIEDSVEIGANTCVDRGTLGNTVIGQGTKIDNLVHVAHNARIGKHCVVVALSLIGGGSSIGDCSWVAPCACIRDGLAIGNRSLVGMGAVVTRDVADDVTVYGVPAKPKEKTNERF